MNKNTEKTLELAVKKLVRALEKTTTFAVEQAPDVLKEMIIEAKISCAFVLGISTAILAACSITMYHFISKASREVFDNHEAYAVATIAGIGAAACVVVIVWCLETLVTLKYCPKLFLLKQLKELATPSGRE